MSNVTIDSEKIAEVRNALQVIQLNADLIGHPQQAFHVLRSQITIQVKRIDKLLPVVKFEGENKMFGKKHLRQLVKFIENAEMTTPFYDGLEDVLRQVKERLEDMIINFYDF